MNAFVEGFLTKCAQEGVEPSKARQLLSKVVTDPRAGLGLAGGLLGTHLGLRSAAGQGEEAGFGDYALKGAGGAALGGGLGALVGQVARDLNNRKLRKILEQSEDLNAYSDSQLARMLRSTRPMGLSGGGFGEAPEVSRAAAVLRATQDWRDQVAEDLKAQIPEWLYNR